jgi:hypothetical protein
MNPVAPVTGEPEKGMLSTCCATLTPPANSGRVSDMATNFSPSHAASPDGESTSEYPIVCGRVRWIIP